MGCLPFHDGIHGIDVPFEQVVLHGFQDEKNLRRHEKHAEKKDCQQTHANLIQLGAGEGGSAGGEDARRSSKKRDKPGTSHIGVPRAYGACGNPDQFLPRPERYSWAAVSTFGMSISPALGLHWAMAMHAARLVPDAFRHVAGLRLGRQGFHMGFNLGEGFLGLFELVGHERSSLRKSVSERRL